MFPFSRSEWHDASRDTVRCFWKGDGGLLGFRGALRYYDTRCLTQLVLRVEHIYMPASPREISWDTVEPDGIGGSYGCMNGRRHTSERWQGEPGACLG
jgi:hypothetical protein